MEPVPAEQFLQWAHGLGIGFHPSYPDARCLTFLPPRDHARFWTLPLDPATWPHFVASLLGGLDDWTAGFLWPRGGSWPRKDLSRSYNEGVRDVVLRGAGIPNGYSGAIRFEREQEAAIVAVLFTSLSFGWCTDDDIYFIPDHGRQLIQTDHHNVVHAECASEERVQQLVRDMAEAGYELPTEPPDWTFKRPAWMRRAPNVPDDEYGS